MGTTIRLEHVVKCFGRKEVIHDLSFETREGEFSFLLGPSGAGKTTTLNLIAGVVPITKGNIYIGDKLVNDLKPKDRNVAIAFESYALYPNRTVYGNMRFPLDAPIRKNSISEEEKDRVVRKYAKMLQIDDLLDRFPKELSGGQRQRVALGRTLVRTPSVYLLDEPIAHLDAKLRHAMRAELKQLQQELGIPFICTSPDQSEAVAMADRIYLLNKGNLEQTGTSKDLYFHPKNEFVALMLGEPKMTISPFSYRKEGDAEYFVNEDLKLPVPKDFRKIIGDKVVPEQVDLGIRPTDFKVSFTPHEGYEAYTVDFFQINGEKFVITAIHGNTKFVIEAKREPGTTLSLGQKLYLHWETENIYLFDPVTKVFLL